MTEGENEDAVAVRMIAGLIGLPLRAEDQADVIRFWSVMKAHRSLVQGVTLADHDEPAALFRP